MATDLTAYTGTWAIDPSHSRLGFTVRHAMVTKVRGSFNDFEGTLVLDGATPSNSNTTLTAQVASISTGNEQRDGHVKSPDFFDVENIPTLTFTSTAVRQDGDDFVVTGDLTIKGTTQSVDIEVEPTGVATDPFGNHRAGFEGELEISREAFGLTWNVALETGGFLVGDKIKISLDVSAIKAS